MNLNATNKSVQVKLGEAINAAQLDVTASYVDLLGNNYAVGANDLVTNGTSLVTAVASPSGSDIRTVKEISITNTDTIPHNVIVYYVAGANQRVIQEALLETGQTLQYANGLWTAASSAANQLTPTPLLIGLLNNLTIYDRYTLGNLTFSIASLITADMLRMALILGDVGPRDMPLLIRLALPVLNVIGGEFSPQNLNAVTSMDLPALSVVGGNFSPEGFTALAAMDLSSLVTVGGIFGPVSFAALTALDLPALVTTGGFVPQNFPSLISIDLSSLASVTNGGIAVNSGGGISTVETVVLTSTLKSVAGDVSFEGNALDQTSVDLILVRLAALDGTGGTTSYDSHTVDLSGGTNSTPSATGLAAKATLEGRGNTVLVN